MKPRLALIIGAYPDIGKGLFSASLAYLGKQAGLDCGIAKFDGYLNPTSGNMNPYHRQNPHPYTSEEIFVLEDGCETDADHGTYERFLNTTLSSDTCMTNGQLFQSLFTKIEGKKFSAGEIIKFKHLRIIMQKAIQKIVGTHEFFVLEIGGSVGDEETTQLYKAIAEMRNKGETKMTVFLLAPYLTDENDRREYDLSARTKLARKSFIEASQLGLVPDFMILRAKFQPRKEDLAYVQSDCDLPDGRLLVDVQQQSIYSLPSQLAKQGLDKALFGQRTKKGPLEQYARKLKYCVGSGKSLSIGILGKTPEDSIVSLLEAIEHAATAVGQHARIDWIDDNIAYNQSSSSNKMFSKYDGIIVAEGLKQLKAKMDAIQYCLKKDRPCLAISFGMDIMIAIENGLSAEDIRTIELRGPNKLVCGVQPISLLPQSKAGKLYQAITANERFRRWEKTVSAMPEQKEWLVSGSWKESPCIIERKNKQFVLGVSFHPEYNSRPMQAHPLFKGFIMACKQKRNAHRQ